MTKRREMTVQKSNSSQSNESLEKTPIDGKDRRQEEKEVTEDEMVGWHHRLDGPVASRNSAKICIDVH